MPMSKTILPLCTLVLAALFPIANATADPPTEPVVSNVQVSVRGNYVDVTYDLEQAEGLECVVFARLSKDGGNTYPFHVLATAGSINKVVAPGTSQQFTWNAYADYPGENISMAGIRLVAFNSMSNVVTEIFGIEGYWPFDTDFLDVSGNDNNPSNHGVTIEPTGKRGGCAYISLGTRLMFPTLNVGKVPGTWAFWYKPIGLYGGGGMVFSLHGPGYPGAFAIAVGTYNSISEILSTASWSGASIHMTASTNAEIDNWVHIAFVLDSDSCKLYINGHPEATNDGHGVVSNPLMTGPYLGNTPVPDWWGKNVNGYVDEFLHYDRALSGDEIMLLYMSSFKL